MSRRSTPATSASISKAAATTRAAGRYGSTPKEIDLSVYMIFMDSCARKNPRDLVTEPWVGSRFNQSGESSRKSPRGFSSAHARRCVVIGTTRRGRRNRHIGASRAPIRQPRSASHAAVAKHNVDRSRVSLTYEVCASSDFFPLTSAPMASSCAFFLCECASLTGWARCALVSCVVA
jgi:hypothetical protein